MTFPRNLLITALGTIILLPGVEARQSGAPLPQTMIQNKFVKEPGLKNRPYDYIVRMHQPAAVRHLAEAKRAKDSHSTQSQRLDVHSPQARAYVSALKQHQQSLLHVIEREISHTKLVADFQYALNGMVLRLTPKQAAKVASLPDVAFVERSVKLPLMTDASPAWTGADQVWEGFNGLSAYQGEGVVIGILDTGINTDHPAFAQQAGDGYEHQNPAGGFLGDCQTSPQLCNNKLIGVYSYDRITSRYDEFAPGTPQDGEDHNGHGSHVAGAAAGNILLNVPLLDADGDPMPDFTFSRMAGIAPRANLISYQVCEPGEEDDVDFAGCWTDLVVTALEQAIIDGVDVINHSIGASFISPWQGSKGQAFLNAREAGIIVANSAGNSGPDPESASADTAAPWVLNVAAYTHDRVFSSKTLGDFSGGDTAPATIEGEAKTSGITASIVYAGDFTNPNDPSGDPAQCLQPFPAGTFSGEIVVCDRGEIARIDKGKHVKEGGAGGMVLANVTGDAENLVADNHVLPSIHINASDGEALRTWLASGTGHTATISSSEIGSDPELANIAADFTSRGPNATLTDVITPSLAAPGVDIWSAYADDQPDGFKQFPDPADYAFLSGTSMAAPHVAGAAALLRGLHPQWSAAQIQSALMLSANPITFKEDSLTPSDPFDMGSGMLDVSNAADAGLIMDIAIADYEAANPDIGGDPKTLNMPSLADSRCFGSCSWQRTVEATRADTWSVDIVSDASDISFSVTPQTFSLASGQQQQLQIEASTGNAEQGQWVFASVQLSSATGQLLTMPVAIKPQLTTLPQSITVDARRNADSVLLDEAESVAITQLTVRSYGLALPQSFNQSIPEDSNNDDVFDDLGDGVAEFFFSVPVNAKRFVVETIDSDAPDLDLWVGRDENNDGVPQEEELIQLSATASAIEKVDLSLPEAGEYWVLVQNWQGSGGESDNFTLLHTTVEGVQQDNLSLTGPDSVALQEPFALRLGWNQTLTNGGKAYGAVDLGTSPEQPGNLGLLNVDLIRQSDDVTLIPQSSQRILAGEQLTYSIQVAANSQSEDRTYVIDTQLPEHVQLISDSVSGEHVLTATGAQWQITQPAGSATPTTLSFAVSVADTYAGGPVGVSIISALPEHPGAIEEEHASQSVVQVEGAPLVLINNQSNATLSGTSGSTLTLNATASDPNDDALSVQWQQTSGTEVSFNQSVLQPSITLPVVSSATTLGFSITVTDPTGLNSQASVSVTVNPRPVQTNSGSGGGSIYAGLWALLLLSLRRMTGARRS
ncbi:S8 family serine peptidase [Lacimicrobium sp. SS2-24]|uniref:S8 family serine peptidase n=1 Tax=Lacimicrobium sp. SS2-24 TaxID=2005569 RepID=UPI000B4C0B27|nr:S8 family serine peptidase [Lacimicrobium sp. SS2-24]